MSTIEKSLVRTFSFFFFFFPEQSFLWVSLIMFSWIRSMGNLQIWTLTSLVFSRTKVEDRTFYLQSAHDFECSKL